MGYRSTESDPDIRIKKETPCNVTDYYKYMLVYVNDVIHLEMNVLEDMFKFNQFY